MTKLEEAALAFAKADREYDAAIATDTGEYETSRAAYAAMERLKLAAREFADEVAEDERNPEEDDRPGLG